MSLSSEMALHSTVVRMVVPMRREFGHDIDVREMLRDRAYARAVIAEALTSDVERLRGYARLAEQYINDARPQADADMHATQRAAASALPPALQRRAMEVSRDLVELIGPLAGPLAARIEHARDARALDALLVEACDSVADLLGSAIAQDFKRRVAVAAAPG
jgi:hypothetical protein